MDQWQKEQCQEQWHEEHRRIGKMMGEDESLRLVRVSEGQSEKAQWGGAAAERDEGGAAAER